MDINYKLKAFSPFELTSEATRCEERWPVKRCLRICCQSESWSRFFAKWTLNPPLTPEPDLLIHRVSCSSSFLFHHSVRLNTSWWSSVHTVFPATSRLPHDFIIWQTDCLMTSPDCYTAAFFMSTILTLMRSDICFSSAKMAAPIRWSGDCRLNWAWPR